MLHLVLTSVRVVVLGIRRTRADLEVYIGEHRSFEWYWDASDEMPGLDVYEKLDDESKAALLAALRHWGELSPGERPLKSRVEEEHADPLILAAKAGPHRFPAFHAANEVWIIAGYYKKKGQKLGKRGKGPINRAIRARTDSLNRIDEGTYYERI
jgi:hypothetical protein